LCDPSRILKLSKVITVGGLAFDTRIEGADTGEIVVLLHGFPQLRRTWREQVPALATAGHRVIVPDQRGYSSGARLDLATVANYAYDMPIADALAIVAACGGARRRFHFVGRVLGPTNEMNPKHPIDVAKDLKGPVLGLYGGADTGIPNDTVDKMREALKAAGTPAASKSTIHTYPDTPHAFHADYRPSFRKEQAEDGWKRAVEWFKANGV
jgi:dienelactone hydrolase